MTTTLTHPDTVSGTTIDHDGTKYHWTEGYSDLVVIDTEGVRHVIDPFRPTAEQTRYTARIDQLSELGSDEYREMTPDEIRAWEIARGYDEPFSSLGE